jgi:hypothetical protein
MKKFLIVLLLFSLIPSLFAQRTVHVLVPLCDIEHQGVLATSEERCDGDDPRGNLYWGAKYGVKTFFERAKEWKLIRSMKGGEHMAERLLFVHEASGTYMLAEAYKGKRMESCLQDLFAYLSGQRELALDHEKKQLAFGADADLLAFCGHNGLMDLSDFEAPEPSEREGSDGDESDRDLVALACESKSYFEPRLEKFSVDPLVWTSGFMSPEAYTLSGILNAWIDGRSRPDIRKEAAVAYDRYQDCGLQAAKNLFLCKE